MNLNEILVILLVAFAVFKPEKLPELARSMARGLQKIQNLSQQLQGTMQEQIQLDTLRENEKKAQLADDAYRNEDRKKENNIILNEPRHPE